MRQVRASIDDAATWVRFKPVGRWLGRRAHRQMSTRARTAIVVPLEDLWQAAIAGPVAAAAAHGLDVTERVRMTQGRRQPEVRADRHAVRGLLIALAVAALVAGLAFVAAAILRSRRRPARAASPTTRPIAIEVSTSSTEWAGASEDQSVVAAVQLIKGIGPETARRLRDIGIRSVEQVAAWGPDDVDQIAGRLGISATRIEREDWIGQARAASGVVGSNGRTQAATRP